MPQRCAFISYLYHMTFLRCWHFRPSDLGSKVFFLNLQNKPPKNSGNCISVCNMWERMSWLWKWASLDMVSRSFLKQALFFTYRSWHSWLALCHLAKDQLPKSALASNSAPAEEAVFNNPFLRRYCGLSELIFLWQFFSILGFTEGKDHFQTTPSHIHTSHK